MNKRLTRISKYMSFILCHESKSIGLNLDAEGWADVNEFVEKANATGKSVTTEQVLTVVAENDKQRFELNEDKSRVRAIKVSRKAIRKETRQAAAKPVEAKTPTSEAPKPEAPPTGKPVFTRSRLVQRTETP